jgi:hypothetical protein
MEEMTFRRAYNQIYLGKSVRRMMWEDGTYVCLSPEHKVIRMIVMVMADGTVRELPEVVIQSWLKANPRIYKDWRVVVK